MLNKFKSNKGTYYQIFDSEEYPMYSKYKEYIYHLTDMEVELSNIVNDKDVFIRVLTGAIEVQVENTDGEKSLSKLTDNDDNLLIISEDKFQIRGLVEGSVVLIKVME